MSILDTGRESIPRFSSDGVEIREMLGTDSFGELTVLLHEAYREHLLEGRDYLAATQTVEMTQRRCAGGTTLLAFANGRLAGTATMREKRKGACLHGDLSQVAVSPACRTLGLGKRLLFQMEQLARAKGYSFLVCDTAETARDLVAWYLRQGWRKVSCQSHPSSNYYSIVFRKYLDGRPHRFDAILFRVKSLQCHLLWRADGSLRFGLGLVGRLVRRFEKEMCAREPRHRPIQSPKDPAGEE